MNAECSVRVSEPCGKRANVEEVGFMYFILRRALRRVAGERVRPLPAVAVVGGGGNIRRREGAVPGDGGARHCVARGGVELSPDDWAVIR